MSVTSFLIFLIFLSVCSISHRGVLKFSTIIVELCIFLFILPFFAAYTIFSGTCTFIIVGSFCLSHFIMKYLSLSPLVFFVLKSTLCDIRMATPFLVNLQFEYYVFFMSIYFQIMCLHKVCLLESGYWGVFFLIPSIYFCLLIGVMKLETCNLHYAIDLLLIWLDLSLHLIVCIFFVLSVL